MTIQLKDTIFISGVHQAAGTSLTLDAAAEAELVNRKVAVYTARTLTPGEGETPVYATRDTSGAVTGLSAGGGAVLNMYAGKLRGGRAGAIGDSITFNDASSWFHHLCNLSNGRIRRAINAGVAGNTTAQMVARIVAVLPKTQNLDLIFITGGTNDAASAVPLATTMQNVLGMALYARSIGADVVLVNIPPKDTNTAAALAIRAGYVALSAAHNIPLIDPWSTMIDADGTWISGMSGDGIHPGTDTTITVAPGLWAQISPLLSDSCWNGLDAISGMPGALVTTDHFFVDTDANGTPNGFTGYAIGGLVSVSTTTPGDVGNKFKISTSGLNSSAAPVAGEWVAERTITTTAAEGDRLAVSARVSISGYETGIQAHVRTTSPSALAIEPSYFRGNLDDAIVWAELTVGAGGITSIKLTIRLVTTGTVTPSVGFVEVSQMQIWNLTAMGIVG